MSLLLLIDGYNVIAPSAAPNRDPDNRWLQHERTQLLARIATHLEEDVRRRTCVVFDAANPPANRPPEFEVDGIHVMFAVGYVEADDLLEELISSHSAPKFLAVVSSDQRVRTAAKRRGSRVYESQSWLDNLLDGKVGLAKPRRQRGQGRAAPESDKPHDCLDEQDTQHWMDQFGL